LRASRLGKETRIRILVTHYAPDESESLLLDNLAEIAGLEEDMVVIVTMPLDAAFNRAEALNKLHEAACHEEDCVVAGPDVDFEVGPKFISNALAVAYPHTTAYFPIFWSQFNPTTVRLVEKLYRDEIDPSRQIVPARETGEWRPYSFGAYALSGVDARRFRFNEGRRGWGSEDNDFFSAVAEKLNIVRLHDNDLVHVWHLGPLLQTDQLRACLRSSLNAEGLHWAYSCVLDWTKTALLRTQGRK